MIFLQRPGLAKTLCLGWLMIEQEALPFPPLYVSVHISIASLEISSSTNLVQPLTHICGDRSLVVGDSAG